VGLFLQPRSPHGADAQKMFMWEAKRKHSKQLQRSAKANKLHPQIKSKNKSPHIKA